MDPENRKLNQTETVLTKQMFGSSNYQQAKVNTIAAGGPDYFPNAGGVIKRLQHLGVDVATLSDEQKAKAYRLDFKMERARRYNALGIFSLVLGLLSLLAIHSDRQVFLTGVGLIVIGLVVIPIFVTRIRAINRDLKSFIGAIARPK